MPFPERQFEKLIIRAMHHSTPANEARVAATKAREFLERAGISSSDISISIKTIDTTIFDRKIVGEAYAELRRENEMLRASLAMRERELERASRSIKCLEAEVLRQADAAKHQTNAMREANQNLRSQLKKQLRGRCKQNAHHGRTQEYNEFVPFQEVRAYFKLHLKMRFCKTMLGLALGISMNELNAWEKVEYFPADLFRKLETVDSVELEPSPPRRWADHDLQMLSVALLFFDTNLDVAMYLTQSLGRRVSESTVASRRRKLARKVT